MDLPATVHLDSQVDFLLASTWINTDRRTVARNGKYFATLHKMMDVEFSNEIKFSIKN